MKIDVEGLDDLIEDVDNEIGLTKENLQNSKPIFEVRMVTTDSHAGLVFSVSKDARDMPLGIKIGFIEGLKEVMDVILNEPEETRQ